MPPSGAESVATVRAARMRTRARYVRHRYSILRPLPPPRMSPTFTTRPTSPTRDSKHAHLPLPSLGQITGSLSAPTAITSPPLLSSSSPLRPLQSRAPFIDPATTSCVCPHSPNLYVYTRAHILARTIADQRRCAPLLLSLLLRKLKSELRPSTGQ